MRRCENHMTHNVIKLQLAARHTTASAALRLERAGRYGFDILGFGHHDDEFLVVGEVFN